MRISFNSVILTILHLCIITLAAIPPSSVAATLQPITANGQNPYNLTAPRPLNALPADPTLYIVPQSTQSIIFSRYSRTLPQKDVLSCLLQAANMAIKELNSGYNVPIDEDQIQTFSDVAHLIFYPSTKMTWGMVCSSLSFLLR